MPHVKIRWRPDERITEEVIGRLANALPEICAPALSIPWRSQYQPSGIVVAVDRQSDLDVNMPLILIEIFVTGSEERVRLRYEARDKIIEGIRAHMGDAIAENDASIWLLLPEHTSFSRF